MAATIVITCPHCKKQLKGPAELQGKKVRCKGCDEPFTVPAAAPPRPAAGARPAPPKPAPQPARTPAKPPPKETRPDKPEPKKSVDAPDLAGYAFLDHETALKRMEAAEAAAKPEAQTPAGGKKKGFEADANPYGVTTLDLTPRCPHCAKEIEEGDIICVNCGYNSETRTFGRTRKVRYVTGGDRFLWLLPGIGAILLAGVFIGIALWFDYVYEGGNWEDSGPRGFMIWVSIPCGLVAFFALRFAFKRLVLHPSPPEQEIG